MTKPSYDFQTAKQSTLFDTTWDKAQQWCNFVLFKPTWLPNGLTETSNKIRPESPEEESSHRVEFNDSNRSLSIKQFLYDWAPPAYDHPCLWRNPKISTPENTPLPKAYLIENNYLWFGLDYRRKSAATINMKRTQIEITVLHGTFDDHEIIQIVNGLAPVDINAQELILATSFADLMFNYRYPSEASEVPTSYFAHTRTKSMKCYPYPSTTLNVDLNSLVGHWLTGIAIEDYSFDSIFLFGQNHSQIQEVEYYFESLRAPGSYIRFLVTQKDAQHSIEYPAKLGDQECNYAVQKLENNEDLYHAWSKTNDHGSHSLVFQSKGTVINCIIKPAPWTTVNWAREICAGVIK